MASSQVEMASAPFGCVLRDHNRRDLSRESKARATMGVFQKNLKSLVRDHLCIAVTSYDNDPENKNENSNNNRNGEREDGPVLSMTPKHARVLDRWTFARQMAPKPIERRRSAEAELYSGANSENQNHNSADSCVRRCGNKDDENSNRNGQREDGPGSGTTQKHAKVLDRWAFARQMVAKPIERQRSTEAELCSLPNSESKRVNNVDSCVRNKEASCGTNKDDDDGKISRNGQKEDGSHKHAKVLDRWAFAKQQMVTKPIERQKSTEAAEVHSVPNSAPSSARTSSVKEETLARTDCLAELTKKGVGASSLVQIWEKRLHQAESPKNESVASDTSRSSSGVSYNDNENENEHAIVPSASPSRFSEAEKTESPVEKAGEAVEKTGDSVSEMDKARESIDESYDAGDYSFEEPNGSAVDGKNLDAKQKEKVRVVDTIRRLTAQEDNSSDNFDQQIGSTHVSPGKDSPRESLSRDRCSGSDQAEHRGFNHVISSPRIRGRQAFSDLLMQMERDRHKELDTIVNFKTVSRFPERGRSRIKGGVASPGADLPPRPPKATPVNKPPQRSSIVQLREKFSTCAEPGNLVQIDTPTLNGPHKEINKPSESTPNREVNVVEQKNTSPVARAWLNVCAEAIPSLENSSTSNKPSESTTNREVHVVEQKKTSPVLHASKDVCEEATPSTDKSSTSNKPSESTPDQKVNVLEQKKTFAVLRASEDVWPEVTPSSDKISPSVKRSESTPNQEANVVKQKKTFPVLRASEEICEAATPNLDKSSTSSKPSREVNVVELKKISPVVRASDYICVEVTPSLDKSSTSSKPSEGSPSREANVVELKKTSPVARAWLHVCEEATARSAKSSTCNQPSERTLTREAKVVELKKTSPELLTSEDVCEQATTPSVEVTSSVSQSTLLHVSEDLLETARASLKVTRHETRNLDSQETAVSTTTVIESKENESGKGKESVDRNRQETSSVVRSLHSQETSVSTTTVVDSKENESCKGKESVDRNLESQETADTTSSNGCNGYELLKPASSEARHLGSQQSADTRKHLIGGDGDGNEISKETSSEARNLDTLEAADTTSSLHGWNENGVWHDTSLEARNFDSQENADETSSLVDWDENDDYYQYYGESNYDWISEISRPRSYWEDIRKSWYQEMLNSNSEKGEIHQLLERRTVSNFLSSEFRDRIDRLMSSRVERQTCQNVTQEEEEEAEEEEEEDDDDNDDQSSYDRMNQMVSFLQQRINPSGIEEKAEEMQEHEQVQELNQVQEQALEDLQIPEQVQELNKVQEKVLEDLQIPEQVREHQDQEDEEMTEEDDDEENNVNEQDEDDEESRSLISAQFQEACDYFDRGSLQTSPHFTTWSYKDNEVGDYLDRATSPSPPRQESPFRSYYPISPQRSPPQSDNGNHRQRSPSLIHPSMEMDLIYDLKSHMIQLYQEMSELRKSIKSCVDMQMTMQQSMKQDVHSGHVGKKRNSKGLPKKGICRICNEAKIDSLLYRCGHMCTCLKCAHDLQWNSGKCPICQAPIADVVKAHMDS